MQSWLSSMCNVMDLGPLMVQISPEIMVSCFSCCNQNASTMFLLLLRASIVLLIRRSHTPDAAVKVDSTGDPGSVLQQLSYRKAAMFALAKQAEASSQAASNSEKELRHNLAKIKELKAQLSKVR